MLSIDACRNETLMQLNEFDLRLVTHITYISNTSFKQNNKITIHPNTTHMHRFIIKTVAYKENGFQNDEISDNHAQSTQNRTETLRR